jgi:3-(3-hydroxy-phenyl)propionate hydroxylase
MASGKTSPVLIAGCGPVGLTAALVLARAAVPVVLFERDAILAEDLRASTWHPPTLDMLDAIDASLSKRIIEMGLIARHTNYHDRRDGLVASFDMELLRGDTNHPYRVQCEQWKYTRMLAAQLGEYPHVRIVYEAAAAGVEQTADAVTLHYDTPGGRASMQGAYLIAADGAWSAVRAATGIEFEGYTYPERFYVASTEFDFAPHVRGLSLVNYISDPEEWCVLLRVPGIWRVLFPTKPEEPDEDVVSDSSTEARLQGVLKRAERYVTTHRTIYRVHQRVAKTYRAGRVFLAGDAAHINNPLGGMGMNGGMHDGINLAEKLARVVRGEADAALLDCYEPERRPIAIEYINANTARNKRMMEERDPAARRRAQDEMRRTASDPAAAREFLRKSSMITALRGASLAR